MQPIPGKQIAAQIKEECKQEVKEKGIKAKLAALLVGDDPASHIYVSLKEKAAHKIGVETDTRRLPASATNEELIAIIKEWNEDESVTGILIQLPLPEGHDTDAIIVAMDPKKDADGFHPDNIAKLEHGEATILSPLHEGILRLIASTPIVPNHAFVIILANSHTFADPLKWIFERAGADVDVMLADKIDDKELREADVIVTAVGKPGILTSNATKPGACVIDVGITKMPDGSVQGDFDAESAADLDGWYSPVPGGVGPMTVALLIKNVIRLAERR
ncbi:bifunctional 5,10-methylene-tetrahydrofolate dehydrogenase/5,10-methylene-tetrahydrofolate cyclohydrolase [Candidatus Uhrbacteria bacterium]|nr:bifunctional 5,10-methylene-tetrahydrofolate dehydrogenase/5,10-methylene-tetrahydrofolate cyclohydrolase [Candidatus Uhrbacteria bacterium]